MRKEIENNEVIEGTIMDPVEAMRKGSYFTGIYEDAELPGLTPVIYTFDGGWEWESFAAWTDGARYFWFSDAGCSCSGPGEEIHSLADMENGSKDDLIRAYSRWASEDTIFMSQGDKDMAQATIRAAIREARKETVK